MKCCNRTRTVLVIIVFLAVVTAGIVAYPVIRRKINDRDLIVLMEDADWAQVGEFQGGAQDVTVRFHESQGPLQLEIRAEHLIGGEWTQGEAFSLHIAEEKLCSLPEAQKHRFMARAVREPDDDRDFVNGAVRVLLTPVK